MSSADKNLSVFRSTTLPDMSAKKIAIVVSEWNDDITDALYQGAMETLRAHGVRKENILTRYVPGSFELSLGAQGLAQREDIDAVVALGCVIQGDTKHFDFICQAVAHGITDVSLKYNKPVVFGVLTPNTKQQALDRAGGKHGNKGDEAAMTALKMIAFQMCI